MANKKKRDAPHRTATRKPDRVVISRSGRGYRPQPLRSTKDAVNALLVEGEADGLLAQLPALLWIDAVAYQQLPSNLCLAASHSLRQAYRWLGLQADVVPVTLAIEDVSGRSGGAMYGNARPHFTSDADGDGFIGHCILRLPELGRFIDATAGQFPQIAAGTGAPIVGRDVTGTHDLLDPNASPLSGIAVQRENWLLTYRPVERGYAPVVYEHGPYATAEGRDGWHENGMKLVAQALALLSVDPDVTARARTASCPRLDPLLTAITGARWTPSEEQLDLFVFPDGSQQQLRNLSLPLNSPAPLLP